MNWNPTEHYQNHDVAAGYDAARFSSIPGKVFDRWEKQVISKCFRRVPTGATLVDVPCGTGRLAERLLALGYRVHGMDISDEMLQVARRRLQQYGSAFTWEVADATSLPQNGPVYGGTLCARVLMHFPLEQQISFLAGVARLGSTTVVINHSFDSPYQRLRRRIKRMLGHRAPANFPISSRDIRVLLERAGLREVKRYRLLSLISEAIYIVAEPIPKGARG
ncbi:MAG TPA: class I SAM-dependent methyltransferase [Rhodanobacteraceae bacterium]